MGDWVEGQLVRVLYHSEQSGYAIARLLSPIGHDLMVVGPLGHVVADAAEGTFLAVEGQWEDHPIHGRQFRGSGALTGTPRSLEGMVVYLGSAGIPGVGRTLAKRIVDHFGERTPTVLTHEPQRLTEVAGIGARRVGVIAARWRTDASDRALVITLRGLGLSARLVDAVRRRFGERTAEVVAAEPYRLAEEVSGIAFRTADALARAQGMPLDHPDRARAAVAFVLDECQSDGHCFLTRRDLATRLHALDVPAARVDDAIGESEARGVVVVEAPVDEAAPADDRVYPAALYRAETACARDVAARLQPAQPTFELDAEVDAAARWANVTLDEDQRVAVKSALCGGLTVVTGGPGTGKTTLLRVLVRAATERGLALRLASPTGRAARRMEEATGTLASTLHRLLEYNPGEGRFVRSFTNPIDGDGLIIDEVSMVDLGLLEATLDALPQAQFPVVLVGDADQLPSVGAGQVLRDLIDSGVVPTVRLTQIHRQEGASGIIRAARAIHAGEMPVSGTDPSVDDCFFLARNDAAQAVETLIKVVAERLPARGFDARRDVQVLAPTRRGPLGTETLNRALQARLNPDGPALTRGERTFRVGDRVICTKNRYDVEVFNGDVGFITSAQRGGLLVDVDGREVAFGPDELGMVDLAYCVTVHKAQGSEYPAVVLALHGSHSVMLRRNLFYTAVTRARNFFVCVGSPGAWRRAVRSASGDERNTTLAERLQASCGA